MVAAYEGGKSAKIFVYAVPLLFVVGYISLIAQNFGEGRFQGDVQLDAQLYREDTLIGAEKVASKILANSYLYAEYVVGDYRIGLRYEGYFGPLLGYPPQYEGQGIPFRFLEYRNERFLVTIGNFYEQFGTGMVLRTYEERQLGIANSIDGVRIGWTPLPFLSLRGFIGKQRLYFDYSPGIIRGFAVDVAASDLLHLPFYWDIGISGVSKYQADQVILDPNDRARQLRLPLNVPMVGIFQSLTVNGFSLDIEYAQKWNDPTAANSFTYTNGSGLWIATSYSTTGFGVNLAFRRAQNLDFRSDRNLTGNAAVLNYLPPLTRQHSFRLAANSPYATQPNGEVGFAADVYITFPRHSFLGGDYGSDVEINYSQIHSLDTQRISPYKYTASFPGFGDQIYYREFSVEFSRYWTSQFKTVLLALFQRFNKDIIEGVAGYGMVRNAIVVGEMQLRAGRRDFVRLELQHLWAKQEDANAAKKIEGNILFGLAEYSIAPHWFFSVSDEFHYDHPENEKKIHYFSASITYVWNAFRLQLGYGRQPQGIVCVGGICRIVPASNGVLFSFSGSF